MARQRELSDRSFRDVLPERLSERSQSFRQFAHEIGVDQAYLSQAMTGKRSPSKRLLEAIANALGVQADYFPEYRQIAVIEAVKSDAQLRDRIYDSLSRRPR